MCLAAPKLIFCSRMSVRPPHLARHPTCFAGGLADNRCVPWLAPRSWHRARAEAGGLFGEEGADVSAAAPGRQRLVRVRVMVTGCGYFEGDGNRDGNCDGNCDGNFQR